LFVAALLAALALGGCASTRSPLMDSVDVLFATGGTGVVQSAIPEALDMRYRYLRVEVPGHPPGLLVLGYEDAHPLGPIEVWYSASRETLRTQNGRLIGSTGTLHDWLALQTTPPPPDWAAVPAQGSSYVRRHDEMPGYRFGVAEQVQLRALSGLPDLVLPATLPPDKARSYQWFRESSVALGDPHGPALPDAWFAWGLHRGMQTVVFSRQCLAVDFCLTLQRWPVQEEAK
jgi:hypothetical protein